MTIDIFASMLLGLIVLSVTSGLAWSRFMGPLRELDSHVLEEPTPSPCHVSIHYLPATTAELLKKAEARLQAHRDTDDLGPIALDRIRKFNDGVYEPMPVRTSDGWSPADSRFWQKEFTETDLTDPTDPTDDMPDTFVAVQPRPTAEPYDFESYRRARAARQSIEGDGLGAIWVLPAGEWTEAQLDAVALAIDTEAVKS